VDRIVVSIKDENGQDIIDSGKLTANIANGSLNIGAEKLRGMDNFTIDAKRLTCKINLPYRDDNFRNSLVNTLTDTSRLIQDELETVSVPCVYIQPDFIKDFYSFRTVWGTNYAEIPLNANNEEIDDGTNNTWDYHNERKFILKSAPLQKMLGGASWNFLYRGYRQHTTNWVGFDQDSSNRGWKDDNDNQFDIGFYTVIEMFAQGLIDWYAQHYGSGTANYRNVDNYLELYLNSIYGDFGTVLKNELDGTEDRFMRKLFVQDWQGSALDWYVFENPTYYSWVRLDHLLCNSTAQVNLGNDTIDLKDVIRFYKIEDDAPVQMSSTYESFSSYSYARIAAFINSLIRYAWYKRAINYYVANGFPAPLQSRPDSGDVINHTSTVMFHQCIEPIAGTPAFNDPPSEDVEGSMWSCPKYHRIWDTTSNFRNIEVLRPVPSNQFEYRIKFGKPKLMTRITDPDGELYTDSGMAIEQVIAGNHVNTDRLFVPVYRTYTFHDSYFYEFHSTPAYGHKMFIDALDYMNLASNPALENILLGTGYTNTNWMFFDNMGIREWVFMIFEPYPNTELDGYPDPPGVVLDDNLPRHEIPVFDPINGNQSDNYGAYIYKDYFDKYYTKEPSKLMHLYITVSIVRDSNISESIYKGIIDYSTMKIEKDSISFEATDSIGALIENLKKLADFVDFSQFDILNGASDIAILMAGTTLRGFILNLLSHPMPYRHKLRETNLQFYIYDIPFGCAIDNKILDNISAEDAFMMAIQSSNSFILIDNESGCVRRVDANDLLDTENLNEADIDGHIISFSENTNIDYEPFSIDKLKKIAGWNKFAPQVAALYNQTRGRYQKQAEVSIFGQTSEIKILDKIWINGRLYLVTEKSHELR
jgi:hypothetical protein